MAGKGHDCFTVFDPPTRPVKCGICGAETDTGASLICKGCKEPICDGCLYINDSAKLQHKGRAGG